MTMGAEGAESDEARGMWCFIVCVAANAEDIRTKGHKNIRTKDITFVLAA